MAKVEFIVEKISENVERLSLSDGFKLGTITKEDGLFYAKRSGEPVRAYGSRAAAVRHLLKA